MSTASVWMEVENHHFDPAASVLTWELCIKPAIGMTTDDAAVGTKVKTLFESRPNVSAWYGT